MDSTERRSYPTYAMLRGVGRCQVLYYRGDGRFMVLDPKDDLRLVHRDRLIFLPERGSR